MTRRHHPKRASDIWRGASSFEGSYEVGIFSNLDKSRIWKATSIHPFEHFYADWSENIIQDQEEIEAYYLELSTRILTLELSEHAKSN